MARRSNRLNSSKVEMPPPPPPTVEKQRFEKAEKFACDIFQQVDLSRGEAEAEPPKKKASTPSAIRVMVKNVFAEEARVLEEKYSEATKKLRNDRAKLDANIGSLDQPLEPVKAVAAVSVKTLDVLETEVKKQSSNFRKLTRELAKCDKESEKVDAELNRLIKQLKHFGDNSWNESCPIALERPVL